MNYYKPLNPGIARGQRYGWNPGWGPNPAGGHNGDDYLSQVGEPIRAAGDGEVIHAGTFDSSYADNFGWNLNYGGNMVVLNLDGPEGPYVEYGHMDQIHVKTGQRVTAGQIIGTTGDTDGGTGVITGPHLHVGVLPPNFDLNTPTYGRVNPDEYLTKYWTEQEPDMPNLDDIARAVWAYKNPNLDPRDMRQIVADTAGTSGHVIDAVQKMHDVTRDYIVETVIRVSGPAELARQIDAAGAAAAVRDELVNLLKG